MRTFVLLISIVLGWAHAALAAPLVALTSLRQIAALNNTQANQEIPVDLEATVTYFRGYEHLLFVQDDGLPAFVHATLKTPLVSGDRVRIKGTTRKSFGLIIESHDVRVLHHGALPEALPVGFGDLILGQHDSLLVKMRGIIQAADLVWSTQASVRSAVLQVLTDSGYIEVALDSDNQDALNNLFDSEVEITGAAGGEFDDKMQQTGIVLHVSSYAQIHILKSSTNSLWDHPLTPMNQILSGYRINDLSPRIRVRGAITYYQPGSAVVLQDGNKSLWIRTRSDLPLRIGDVADATGFPGVMMADQARSANDGFMELTHGEIKDSGIQAPIAPLPATWQQLAISGDRGNGHHYDLVSIEGRVVVQSRGGAEDEYTLVADGHPFSAIFRHPSGPLAEMKLVPLGSRVRVTGICTVHNSDPFGGPVPFDILLRSFDDVVVIQNPSLVNTRNLLLAIGLLLLVIFAVLARGWALERRMRRQTAATAALEQQRGRILEDINGSRPLLEILEQIVAMVSATLDGAPCWCELADGTSVGHCLADLENMELIRMKIDARSGPSLGALLAAFSPTSPPVANGAALTDGVRLAALAMETRRLYSDLRHRSEFDQLTEIPNRFAMDKRLDQMIEEANQNSSFFGLIYIDLDRFKPVNDLYGHHIGDLYLQQVAVRLSRQLRSGDMLARLGGDEFAALISVVHSRADVLEATQRLKRCFDTPYTVEEHTLQGAASLGIALFPEDGADKDSLLKAADIAMYAVKNTKK